jgi:transposase
VHSYVRALRAFATWLHKAGYRQENVLADVRPPRTHKAVVETLTEAEIEALLQSVDRTCAIGVRDHALITTYFDTGARCGELLALTLEDVHLDEGWLLLDGKGDWNCPAFVDRSDFGTRSPRKDVHEIMEQKKSTKSQPPYPPAFRSEAVALARTSGQSLAETARRLGIHYETLRLWVRQADVEGGQREGLSTSEREELARLRRENRILKEEREILKKATAFFVAESATR